jgi:hypothetical protein
LHQILISHGGFAELDINVVFEGIDLSRSGKILYNDFIAATISRKIITEENLRVAFGITDCILYLMIF